MFEGPQELPEKDFQVGPICSLVIPEGSDLVTIVRKLPQILVQAGVSYGAPQDTPKVCCSDNSVEAARKHWYKWVPYDTREVCCSDDREENAPKHL